MTKTFATATADQSFPSRRSDQAHGTGSRSSTREDCHKPPNEIRFGWQKASIKNPPPLAMNWWKR